VEAGSVKQGIIVKTNCPQIAEALTDAGIEVEIINTDAIEIRALPTIPVTELPTIKPERLEFKRSRNISRWRQDK
jgi:hypothetical protein